MFEFLYIFSLFIHIRFMLISPPFSVNFRAMSIISVLLSIVRHVRFCMQSVSAESFVRRNLILIISVPWVVYFCTIVFLRESPFLFIFEESRINGSLHFCGNFYISHKWQLAFLWKFLWVTRSSRMMVKVVPSQRWLSVYMTSIFKCNYVIGAIFVYVL